MHRKCNATYEYEPDQEFGWCDECQAPTVMSGLMLFDIV